MSNTIQQELAMASTKMIKGVEYGGKLLAEITRENVAVAEAMIQSDSAYSRSFDKNAGPLFSKNNKLKYGGSTAFWMTQLKCAVYDKKERSLDEVIIQNAVDSVNRDNRTHINADGVGNREITRRILDLNIDQLMNGLKYPDHIYKKENLTLIQMISQPTNPSSQKYKPRCNISFASKFCHYACYYVFEDNDEQYRDNYSIYDSVLKKVLPLYLNRYGINQRYDLNNYDEYRKAIDAIREKCNEEISRNGFDHLIWYYHKGRVNLY